MPAKNSRNIIILVIIIALLVVGVVMTNKRSSAANLTPDQAKERSIKFINDILMQGQGAVSIEEISEYNKGVYSMKVKVEGSEELVDSYITKDGKFFFPQGLNIDEMMGENKPAEETQPAEQPPLSDKPVVELFVMSHCPYGTQIEKGILPVAKALGSSIDFQLKFVNYAMHGEKELREEMTQYCLIKEQNDKLIPYLECFLKDETSSDKCLGSVGADRNKLTACVSATDKQYRIIEVFTNKEGWTSYPPFPVYEADNTKYSVGGSPTLVINGQEVSSGRDSASLAKLICSSFNEGKKPAACDQTFSSDSPAAGFGEGTTTGSTDASCN